MFLRRSFPYKVAVYLQYAVYLSAKTVCMAFEVQVQDIGKDQVILLKDNSTGTTAEIFSIGALLNSFSLPVQGKLFNIIDGFSNPAEAAGSITDGFKSAKLSPFTCRMHHGEYQHQGTDYKIEKFYLLTHAIHGIIYDAPYTIADTKASEQGASVTLQYHYPGTDAGYPFTYDVTVQWQLQAGNHLTVTTTIQHQNDTAIPLADGWHPYFKLDVPVNDCVLQFDGRTQLEFDDTLIPTGKLFADERFVEGALMQDTFLDNCFVLDAPVTQPRCTYSSPLLKLTIQPDKAYPYLQIYTPSHRQSIAIENLSAPPDAFNNKKGLILAEKNTPVQFSTTYIIETI